MNFLRRKQRKRDTVVGLDLGVRQIKAVVLRRQGEEMSLADYGVGAPAVPINKPDTIEPYAAEVRRIFEKLKVTDRTARVSVSCPSAMVCEAEIQRMSIDEVRAALKLPANSLRYLRRDLSGHYLDVLELPEAAPGEAGKRSPTMRVLVGGAAREEVQWYCAVLQAAKIEPEAMELAALTVINAFQISCPEVCANEVVVLIDIGSLSTSINVLRQGQLALTRIMQFGGETLTTAVAQALGVEAKVAEEEKLRMAENVQPVIRQALTPLVREVRSSIDYVERQYDCHVARAFACGGSACSFSVVDSLAEGVGLRIEPWNPVATLNTSHFNGEGPALMSLAPSLASVIGAAVVPLG
jgi:type IV pilus assembly protein PilM